MARSQRMPTHILFCLLVILFTFDTRARDLISCGVSFCKFGKPALFKCFFHKHIIESKTDVSVERFADEHDPGTNVFICSWKEDPNAKCRIAPEYALDSEITDTLTLRIPNATKEEVGTYKCQIIPPNGTISHVCEFIGPGKKAENASHELTTFHIIGAGDKVETTSQTLTPYHSKDTGDNNTSIILGAFLAIMTAACVALFIMYIRQRQRRYRRWQKDKNSDVKVIQAALSELSTPDPPYC